MPPYKVQVIADSSGKFCGNGLTFPDLEAARDYANDLTRRWTAMRDWIVVDGAGAIVATRFPMM